ncbi:MAG: periplasmic heavy metal sensor [Thermoanaerobaculia bacterium]
MKLSWLWIVLAVSLGINVGILATLGVQGSDKEKGTEEKTAEASLDERTGPIAERLGLEGEDREKFMQLQRGLLESTQGHREELDGMRREVRKELREDEPDRARMERLISDMAEVSAAQEREYVEMVMATREILDDEQQAMYLQFMAQARARGGEGMRPGMQQQRMRPGTGGQQQRMAPGAQQQRMRPGAGGQQQRMRPGGKGAPGGPQAGPQQGQEQEGEDPDGEGPDGDR